MKIQCFLQERQEKENTRVFCRKRRNKNTLFSSGEVGK
jgi:hypothetical protein